MADDGILINFELAPNAFAPKQTFKGGRWRDRMTARKTAEYRRKEVLDRAVDSRNLRPNYHQSQSEDEELVLPAKRPRTDGNGFSRQSTQQAVARTSDRLPKSSHGEVISSLFSYNPISDAPKQETEREGDMPMQPSNAPLDDDLSTFTNLGLSATIANHLLKKLGIKAPTAIQRQAIQQLCAESNDAFIQAETGSGKTLAYLLPIVHRLCEMSKQMKAAGQDFKRESGLFAIVLTPTRELSKQVSTVLEGILSCCHWIVSGAVIGGEKKKSEKARLRKGLNILVATPGRLADHLNSTEVLDVSKVRWLVLDEGDRLMELGFEHDIQKIISVLNLRSRKVDDNPIEGLPDRRTTILCSATIKARVEQLRSIALKTPIAISADPNDPPKATEEPAKQPVFSAPTQLKQSYAIVPAKQRLVTLVALLKQTFRRKGSVMKCIVFLSCADSVDFHFEVLSRPISGEANGHQNQQNSHETAQVHKASVTALSTSNRIPQGNTIPEVRTEGIATAFSSKDNDVQLFRLHGSLQQATRTGTLKSFANSSQPAVLICTDVASRGLDLPNIDLVIEYDPPFSRDDHLHRIGRTARAGKNGRSMIFLMPGCEEGYIVILMEGKPHPLTRHDADELLTKGFSPSAGVVTTQGWEQAATDWQLDVERWALDHSKHLEQARRAFQSQIRAYATHAASERGIFDLKQLHLGHLAKAFALRDKPSSVRVPGQRPGKDVSVKTKAARRSEATKRTVRPKSQHDDDGLGVPAMTDEQEARRRMRAKMKAMSGASEFNLG